jgi:AraC-like DNA-binding protein
MNDINLTYVRHNTDAIANKIPPNTIWFYELTLLLRGKLSYTGNGKTLDMEQGDVICLPPDTLRTREDGEDKSDYISFNFTSDTPVDLPVKMEKAVGNDILLIIAAYDEMCRNPLPDSDVMEKAAHLLSCILLILKDRAKEKSYNPLTLKIMHYLHSNFSKKVTLNDIGKLTFFSPNYCENIFKRETGRSVIDYLLEIRMEEAKKLLAEGVLSLGDVSETVGFEDYNYFSRVFKKRTGYTPSEYKKLISTRT